MIKYFYKEVPNTALPFQVIDVPDNPDDIWNLINSISDSLSILVAHYIAQRNSFSKEETVEFLTQIKDEKYYETHVCPLFLKFIKDVHNIFENIIQKALWNKISQFLKQK